MALAPSACCSAATWAFFVADGCLQERHRCGIGDRSVVAGFVIERRLEILQRQREVQDPDVAASKRPWRPTDLAMMLPTAAPMSMRRRRWGQNTESCAAAGQRTSGETGLTQKSRSSFALQSGSCLLYCTVDIDIGDVQLVHHVSC